MEVHAFVLLVILNIHAFGNWATTKIRYRLSEKGLFFVTVGSPPVSKQYVVPESENLTLAQMWAKVADIASKAPQHLPGAWDRFLAPLLDCSRVPERIQLPAGPSVQFV